MLELQISSYATTGALCLFSLLIISGKKLHLKTPPVYFLAYLMLESIGYIFELLMHHPNTPFKALWLGGLMASSFLIAPCMWLFAREITEASRPALRSLSMPHYLLVVIGALLTLPLLFSAHWGNEFYDPHRLNSSAENLFIHTTMLLCIALFVFQVVLYWKKSLVLLRQHSTHSKALFSTIEQGQLSILRLILVIVVTNWSVSIGRTLDCLFFKIGDSPYALIEMAVTITALIVVMRRSTVFGLEEAKLVTALFSNDKKKNHNQTKYAKSALNAQVRQRILRKLQHSMTNEQFYRNSELTLRTLCHHLNEKAHYVSQVINQDMGNNFFEMVNTYRIKDAKQALLNTPNATVLDIALAAGFNAKSTFNTAFRRHTKMTPSQYRAQNTPDDLLFDSLK